MKSILRNIAFYSFALFITSQVVVGLRVSGNWTTYLMGGAVLTILFVLVKPILSLITLPLTIITLGWFSVIINAIILYLLTIFVSGISISAFIFEGFSFAGFIVPSMSINNLFAFILASLLLSFIIGALKWLTER